MTTAKNTDYQQGDRVLIQQPDGLTEAVVTYPGPRGIPGRIYVRLPNGRAAGHYHPSNLRKVASR